MEILHFITQYAEVKMTNPLILNAKLMKLLNL